MKNCKNQGFSLTSMAGVFVFECHTLMSHAKLVRDQFTAALFGVSSDPNMARVPRNPQLAQKWHRENTNGPAKEVQFTWIPA